MYMLYIIWHWDKIKIYSCYISLAQTQKTLSLRVIFISPVFALYSLSQSLCYIHLPSFRVIFTSSVFTLYILRHSIPDRYVVGGEVVVPLPLGRLRTHLVEDGRSAAHRGVDVPKAAPASKRGIGIFFFLETNICYIWEIKIFIIFVWWSW